jgi:hypothetical protein
MLAWCIRDACAFGDIAVPQQHMLVGIFSHPTALCEDDCYSGNFNMSVRWVGEAERKEAGQPLTQVEEELLRANKEESC